MFINNKFVPAESGKTIDVYNPGNGEYLTKIAAGGEADVEKAVQAGWNAFPEWKALDKNSRGAILRKIADAVEANAAEIALIEVLDNGKILGEAEWDVSDVSVQFRYMASLIETAEGSVMEQGDYSAFNIIKREPLGVVGQIVPWNYPICMAGWKMSAALAAGNCVVIKPSSLTSLSLLKFAEVISDILPAGVLNVVTGGGRECGNAILNNKGIRKLAFTGSTEVGRQVGMAAGKRVIPATLELGGKSANIVFEDAQWDRAIEAATGAILGNSGQICNAGSRLLVQESIYDKFVKELGEKFAGLKVGYGLDPDAYYGAMTDVNQMKKVLEYIEIGKKEGATLVTGGYQITTPPLDKGNFIAPTLFADVRNDMRIAQEEIFGPVLVAIPFKDEAEAIAIANDSPYGLAGACWTQDISRGIRVTNAMQAGLIWLNDYNMCPAGTPFGGYKDSGYGREIDKRALEAYTQVKCIYVSTQG